MKKISLLVVFFISLIAQSDKTCQAVFAGINLNSASITGSSASGILSIQAGYKYYFAGNLNFLAGIVKFDHKAFKSGDVIEIESGISYLSLAPVYTGNINKELSYFAGPNIGIKINDTASSETAGATIEADNKSVRLSLWQGLSIWYRKILL